MAEIKGLKKTIVYSSEKEKQFLERTLEILSIKEKKSFSAVLEDLLNKALLPENEKAAVVCKSLYLNDINILECFEKIYEIYAGRCTLSEYQNGLELVELFHIKYSEYSLPVSKEKDVYRKYFCSNLYQIYLRIQKECTAENEDNLLVYENPAKYAKYVLEVADSKPEHFRLTLLTELIKKHWDILKDFTYTYKTLGAFCSLVCDKDCFYQEDKIVLVELIKKLSYQWN